MEQQQQLLVEWRAIQGQRCLRDEPHRILPYLYLCSYRCFREPQQRIAEQGFTHGLSVGGPIPQEVKSLLQGCKELEGLDDRPEEDLYSHFEACYQWMEQVRQSGGKLIVNCYEGTSRSATIVIAYLMKKEQIRMEEAMRRVVDIRPIVNPNRGFRQQLQKWEQAVFCPATGGVFSLKNKRKKPTSSHQTASTSSATDCVASPTTSTQAVSQY
ncbi:Dual specificity protein phosphatase 26 [Balamuthia mandrillaris]